METEKNSAKDSSKEEPEANNTSENINSKPDANIKPPDFKTAKFGDEKFKKRFNE